MDGRPKHASLRRGARFWCVLIAVRLLAAQDVNFDELARRASEAVDTHPEEAAALYGQALALRPNWADGWLYRGASLFELGRFGEARDSFRKGVALDPGKGTPLAFLGMAEYELGDYRQSLSDILQGEAIGLADRPAFVGEVRCRAALIYLRFADFGPALEQLRPLTSRGIKSPGATEALGLSVLNLYFLPSTLPEDRQTLVDLAGRAAWAFLGGHPDESRPLLKQLVEQFPNEPGVHYLNGVFLVAQDVQAAEREFRAELLITPSHVLARVQLAQLLGKSGDTAAAVRLAGEAVRLEPANALCHVTLGHALLSAGRTSEAIAALEKGESLSPQTAKTHFYLVQAYRRAGRTADALREKAAWERLHAEKEPTLSLFSP